MEATLKDILEELKTINRKLDSLEEIDKKVKWMWDDVDVLKQQVRAIKQIVEEK